MQSVQYSKVHTNRKSKNQQLYELIQTRLNEHGIKNVIRTATTGNVHMVITIGNNKYSVTRFATTKNFKIFYPWPCPPESTQEKANCPTYYDVINFFVQLITKNQNAKTNL